VLVWALAGGAALCATSVHAQDGSAGFSVVVTGEVGATCDFEGDALIAAGVGGATQPLEPGQSAPVAIDLEDATDQEIGGYVALCNTPSASVTIESANGFALRNGVGGPGSEIEYVLKVPGVPALSSGVRTTTTYAETLGPEAPRSRRLQVFIGAPDLFAIQPGLYTDQVSVSVVPNP
jgi:hypothetical protein